MSRFGAPKGRQIVAGGERSEPPDTIVQDEEPWKGDRCHRLRLTGYLRGSSAFPSPPGRLMLGKTRRLLQDIEDGSGAVHTVSLRLPSESNDPR